MRARGPTSSAARPGVAPNGASWAFVHTPGMRRVACVFALLLGLAGNGYVAAARVRMPVPIERRLDTWAREGRVVQTLDWWRA